MKYAIVCCSLTGNTGLLANSIFKKLGKERCLYFGEPNKEALSADVIYVGFWTNMGTANQEIAEFLKTIKNKKVFLFGTCGYGLSQEYFDHILSSSAKNLDSSNELIGKFICLGKMKQSVKERYVKARDESKDYAKFDELIKNFDQALSHPNDEDIADLLKLI